MPTSFVSTTFVVLVGLNTFGGLAPVDKALLPPGSNGPVLFSVDSCNLMRGKMEHPEKFTCQVFTSAKSTAWMPPPPEGATQVAPPQEIQPDTNPEHSLLKQGGEATEGQKQPDVTNPERSDYSLLYYVPGEYVWVSEGGGLSLQECQAMSKKREIRFTGVHCIPTPPGSNKNGSRRSFNDGRAASSFAAVQVGPSGYLSEKDSPYIEPRVEDPPVEDRDIQEPMRITPDPQPKKRVAAAHPQHRQQFDPIGMVAALFTPRDW